MGGVENEFVDIPGYESLYQINMIGDVKTLSKKSGSVIRKEKLLKGEITKQGYNRVTLYKNNIGKRFPIHRLVLMAFVGGGDGMIVNHKDGNKLNNHIDNLEWCDYKYNNWHTCNILGKKPKNLNIGKGILCHNSKLVGQFNGDILINKFYGGYDAARYYGVNPKTLHKYIKSGRMYMGYIWKYI